MLDGKKKNTLGYAWRYGEYRQPRVVVDVAAVEMIRSEALRRIREEKQRKFNKKNLQIFYGGPFGAEFAAIWIVRVDAH